MIKNCIICSKEFICSGCQKTCSLECRKKKDYNYTLARRGGHVLGNTIIICKYCKKPFIKTNKHRVYCSDQCFLLGIKSNNRDREQSEASKQSRKKYYQKNKERIIREAVKRVKKNRLIFGRVVSEKERKGNGRRSMERYYNNKMLQCQLQAILLKKAMGVI
jgi:hypothetical protein